MALEFSLVTYSLLTLVWGGFLPSTKNNALLSSVSFAMS